MTVHSHCIRTSVTRAAALPERGVQVVDRSRARWRLGDYVLGQARTAGEVELPSGRLVMVAEGDHVMGALGVRAATLEVVGDWQEVGDDRSLDLLTAGGVLGKCTSAAPRGRRAVFGLDYSGHVIVSGETLCMADTVPDLPRRGFDVPTILILGTSMSAGKTTVASAITRSLSRRGVRVVGAKLAGVGRRRDVLAMEDAGAVATFDFVDAGLPSTAVPREVCATAMAHVMNRIALEEPDVLVAEAGASPLEPYNSDLVVELLEPHARLTVLCASDPYAVPGLMQTFDFDPDVLAGRATSTSAAISLLNRLVGVEAVDIFDTDGARRLDAMIEQRLGLGSSEQVGQGPLSAG